MKLRSILAFGWLATGAFAQGPPNVSQTLIWSTLTNQPINTGAGVIQRPLFSVYTTRTPVAFGGTNFVATVTDPRNYNVAHGAALSSALNANIAAALSVVPLSSPTSGVILKKDPATGALLPASSSLGPIFTQRAETIGKGKLYIGFTQQNYHFSNINGKSLNGLGVLYGGGDPSAITVNGAPTATAPASFNFAMDVKLSQNLAFITYGVTDRLDVSVGLSAVHSAVASRTYNGLVYTGSGDDYDGRGTQCWCMNSLAPGTKSLTMPSIGSASYAKSGFGDMVVRVKGGVFQKPGASLAVGTDIRLPTGDAENYLGIGAAAVKPFAALSLYSKPLANGIVFAPHVDFGWQFSGSSILGGTLQGTPFNAPVTGGTTPVVVGPFTATKGQLPDIMTWAVGIEVAVGRRNTLIFDAFGNHIGLVRDVQLLKSQSITAPPPTVLNGTTPLSQGMASAGRGSFAQYSGSFGYKMKVVGNLVATFQAMVRLNNSGLTDKFVPLYGLGYSF